MDVPRRMITWRQLVEAGWPYSRVHTWRLMRAGRFPLCIKLGVEARCHVFWWVDEVEGHLDNHRLPDKPSDDDDTAP